MAFISVLVSALSLAAAPPPAPEPEPAPAPFRLVWPAEGQVTDGYGPRWGRMHQGIDIGILQRLSVVAAADGTVKKVGWLPHYAGYGLVVLVGHGEGRQTLYAHLSGARVEVGDRVNAGEWIGMAGCTGSCTGTHLHFELRERGVAVDPLPFLRGAG